MTFDFGRINYFFTNFVLCCIIQYNPAVGTSFMKYLFPKFFNSQSAIFLLILAVAFSANTFGQNAKTETPNCADNDYDCLIAKYTKLIKENHDDAEAYYERGTLYAGRGNYDRAIKDFSSAIKLEPENVTFYYSRGRCYYFKNNINAAIADSTKAIEINSEFTDGYLGRGIYLDRIGKKDESLKDFIIAIKDYNYKIALNSADALDYVNHGIINQYLDKTDEAISDYEKAIGIEADNFQIYYYRGMLYFLKQNYSFAIDDFTKAIMLNPNFAESYNERARVYYKIGETEKAKSDRKKYEELSKKL